jgi:hypothetical protein
MQSWPPVLDGPLAIDPNQAIPIAAAGEAGEEKDPLMRLSGRMSSMNISLTGLESVLNTRMSLDLESDIRRISQEPEVEANRSSFLNRNASLNPNDMDVSLRATRSTEVLDPAAVSLIA